MAHSFTAHALIGRFFIRSREPASSVIGHVSYNRLTRNLRITFKRGEVYAYRRVPWQAARELVKASDGAGSVGQVFNTYIRDQFRFKRAA
jgi:hypothetical protein